MTEPRVLRREVSYTDTTVGAVWFNLHIPPRPAPDLEKIVRLAQTSASPITKERLTGLVGKFLDEHYWPLRAHEWCHVLQAFAYPALYLRSLRELHIVAETLRHLERAPEIRRPFKLKWDPEWLATIRGPQEHVYRLTFGEDNIFMMAPSAPDDPPSVDDLTETDLLESDAMIFQFKVEGGTEGSGYEFVEWLRQPRHYARAFKLAARYLGEDDAYIALPALVRASYETTWPVTSFAQLLELILMNGGHLPMQLGVDNLYDFLTFSLKKHIPLATTGPDRRQPGRQEPLVYLDNAALERLANQGDFSPLTPYVRTYLDRCRADPGYPRWLFHPYEFLTGHEIRAGADGLENYRPPITITRVVHPDVRIGQSVLELAPQFVDKPWPPMPTMTFQQYLVDWLRYKQLVFEMGTEACEGYGHYCPHTTCGWHDTYLCRKWTMIPKTFEECSFPDWFAVATSDTLDGRGSEKYLRPLTTDEADFGVVQD